MNDVSKTNILLVEDSPTLARLYSAYLESDSWNVICAETGHQALEFLYSHLPQVMILDLKLPDMAGLDILRRVVKDDKLPCAVLVVTGHGSVHVAVEAMREGAFDFIEKPCNAGRLLSAVRNALKMRRIESTGESEDVRLGYSGFVGVSPPMRAVYRVIDQVAASRATVFITGESGSGKEVCAEAIHRHPSSSRSDKPFVTLNCAAIPKDLLESELFGHVKGAFTGAYIDRQGVATRAEGGTLFLDEICEMDLNIQSKLLRFVQTGTFQKVGGGKIETVDVRLICATNRDPLKEVEAGRFREDLYYRLHVIAIKLPPLRQREMDIIPIAQSFLTEFALEEGKDFKAFDKETEALLRAYRWPGNIRQLQNVIRNIVVLNQGKLVTPEMLPPPLDKPILSDYNVPQVGSGLAVTLGKQPGMTVEGIRPLWLVEKETIEHAIALCDGNIPKAAALLEVSPSTIYRKRLSWENQ
jgi:two-component system repressor protein LuxO